VSHFATHVVYARKRLWQFAQKALMAFEGDTAAANRLGEHVVLAWNIKSGSVHVSELYPECLQ
jgi:hypothetical protein